MPFIITNLDTMDAGFHCCASAMLPGKCPSCRQKNRSLHPVCIRHFFKDRPDSYRVAIELIELTTNNWADAAQMLFSNHPAKAMRVTLRWRRKWCCVRAYLWWYCGLWGSAGKRWDEVWFVLKTVIAKPKQIVSLVGPAGRTLLHYASRFANSNVAKLLALGADPDAEDEDGDTPLVCAIQGLCQHNLQLISQGNCHEFYSTCFEKPINPFAPFTFRYCESRLKSSCLF